MNRKLLDIFYSKDGLERAVGSVSLKGILRNKLYGFI